MSALIRSFLAALAVGAGAWLTAGLARAADGPEDAERANIARERNAAEARFTASDAECRKRFIVSSCLEAAQQERRKTVDALRARQLAVDEARRRERVEARRTELENKSAEDARRDQERAVKASRAAAAASLPSSDSASAAPSNVAGPKAGSRPREKASGISPRRAKPATTKHSERAALEAGHRAAFEKRQAEAAAHRAEAEAAAARRLGQRPAARSLPIPAAPKASSAIAP